MKVKIYTTNHCPYCVIAKNFFKQNNIQYEEVNVETDHKAAIEMVEKSGQTGVPVIEINGHIIIGFDKQKIAEALEKK
ncbi:MAG: glutathione S-transferase N-terminal domain-containing protein [Candidatus Aenigmarchaeota archaeon]|nr:glutathione S-transferase N-terminal domain-containing protein [Candidatus Aenigmarchaeota archaeon]